MSDSSSTLANRGGLLLQIMVLIVVTAAVLGFQTHTGVWTSDIGADPDEPAHAVTSLMVRDYVAEGLGGSPLVFAQRYYDTFPKVALGHYPPGYYALTALFLLPWPHPEVFFGLQALLCGVLAMQVVRMASRLGMSPMASVCAALITISLPITLKLSQLVMADLLLACLCLLAVEFWSRYSEKPRVSMALLFGLTSAAAILTKGSGMALALVPAVSLVGLWRWDWLKKPSFWLAGLPVAVIAGPWMLYSSKITKEGMVDTPLVKYILDGLSFYATSLGASMSYPIVVLAILGGALWLSRRSTQAARCTALLGLVLGTVSIMLLVPAGYSTRYFMPLLPVVALMAVWPLDQWLPRASWRVGASFALVVIVWLHYPWFAIPDKNVAGYRQAVEEALHERGGDSPEQWLVSGDPRGEGAVIATTAFVLPHRVPSPVRVHRASKELAATDWLGRGYKAAFTTPDEVLGYLDQSRITCVFVDQLPKDHAHWPHEEVLLEALQKSDRWKLVHEGPATRPYQNEANTLKVFRLPR